MNKLEVCKIEIGEDGNIYETKYYERMCEMFGEKHAKRYLKQINKITDEMSNRMHVKLKEYAENIQ